MAFAPPQVIWVAQWYPHEGDLYAGDFIQRHARAVALYQPIHLFACFPASQNHRQTTTSGALTETIIYFRPFKTGWRAIDKILLWTRWKKLLQAAIRQNMIQNGRPCFLHCHITLNAGWIGLWAKKRWGIPYLITEHWSGYMTGAVKGFTAYNPFSRRLFHRIVRQSMCVTTVSEGLSRELQSIEKQGYYIRIPNVVDKTIFYRSSPAIKSKARRLLHVSTFSAQKNMAAMLAAFDLVKEAFPDIEFHIIGPEKKFEKDFRQKAADAHYILHGEISQQAIATLMQQCDACVLYSHYETFGCVIIEAHAAGLPVIVSDIPVLREIVRHRENGILVQPDDPEALAKAICSFLSKPSEFDSDKISAAASREFSFQAVGKQFFDLYRLLAENGKC